MSAGTNRIITPLILAFVLLTSIPTFAGKMIYVDDDGPADFNNIQAAINDSSHGDTIIVAKGRYFENINFNGRNITLTSTDPCNPDVVAATIIDGSQNGSVVTFNSDEDANRVLDGFTITNGHAEYGGGIYCGWPPGPPPPPPPPSPPPGTLSEQSSPEILSETNLTAPTIKNCIISNNSADESGGGMENGYSNPIIINCIFNGNSAFFGGGMFNLESSPTLSNCTFSGNSADAGGGMINMESNSILTNCTFNGNSADVGGGMFNQSFHDGECSPILTNCTFNENSADGGGGMYNINSNTTLKNCTFTDNSAVGAWFALGGGGVYNWGSSPTLKNCTFSSNSATYYGGGMCNRSYDDEYESRPMLTNCTFNKNSASSGGGICNQSFLDGECSPILTNCTFNENSANSGGGICNRSFYDGECNPMLTNCTFNSNSASHHGGGMFNDHSSPKVTNCIFSANGAVYSGVIILIYPPVYGLGGGMYNHYSSPIVDNCMFTGNAAGYYSGRGGGMYNAYSNSIVTNCTFSGNRAGYDYHGGGGGMYNEQGSYTMVSNSIFWGNGSNGISGSEVDVTYSGIEGSWPGQGNIDADPCFVDLGYWDSNDTSQNPWDDVWIEGDHHLLPDSPCINAGDPNHLFDPNEEDLDKKLRVIGCRIDMGAFEYRNLVPAEVRIVPHTINLANRGKWITAYLQLPEEYNVSETDFCILLLEDKIEPQQLFINEKEQIIIGRFNDEQLHGILKIGEVDLTISAQLIDATQFAGTDIIKVIDEGGGKLAKLSGKASHPNPADGSMDVGLIDVLSWTAGSSAVSHDVYFGTSSPPPFVCNQTETTFDPGTMDYETTYYWRIDEANKWGTTTGDIWSFTTMKSPPPPPPPPPPPQW